MGRSYGQYCGLARALDVVGDRWNLLIVRELLRGPLRYRELVDGLPGVATNLLTDRLRELETAGVLERRLGGDVNAVVYALTDWGAQLREPIEGLVRWSTPLMVRGPEGDRFHPDWLLVALPAVLAGRAPRDQSSTIGIAVDDAVVQVSTPSSWWFCATGCTATRPDGVRATSTDVEVTMHDGRDLDAVLRADAQIVLGLAVGMLTLDIVQDLVDIQGDEAALVSALRL